MPKKESDESSYEEDEEEESEGDDDPTPNEDVSFNSKLFQQFDVRSNTKSHVQRAVDNRMQ